MEFDYEILKINRKRLKYTQKDVADAIGATVRTYQKWENGETTPDGHYLLRLLNWLDIRDIQDVVRYTE
jgi:transcriptional regulator with XRE-family HTH domain